MKQDDYKQHISETYNTELDQLKTSVLEMGGLVEEQLRAAMNAMLSFDTAQAEQVVENDQRVNEMEKAIDEECSTIIVRRQPAASDLRLLVAVIKLTTDLERIGDEASKIARQALRMAEVGASPSKFIEIRHIGNQVVGMLRESLDAFTRLDVETAMSVVLNDREVDAEYRSALRSLITFMMEDPREIGAVLNEMWALRALERIGDHASNVAEQVIYLARGTDVRHQPIEKVEQGE